MWVSFQEGKNWAPKVLYLRYATVFGREIYFVLVEGGTSKPHDKDVTTGMGEQETNKDIQHEGDGESKLSHKFEMV